MSVGKQKNILQEIFSIKNNFFKIFLSGLIFLLMSFFSLMSVNWTAEAEPAKTMTVDGQVYPVHTWIVPAKPQLPLSNKAIVAAADETANLPVVSVGLSGLQTNALSACQDFTLQKVTADHLPMPILVLGDDLRSKQFLRENLQALQKMQAKILIVSVNSLKDFQALKQLAGPVPVMAVNGEGVQKRFGVNCYPAFIVPKKPNVKNR